MRVQRLKKNYLWLSNTRILRFDVMNITCSFVSPLRTTCWLMHLSLHIPNGQFMSLYWETEIAIKKFLSITHLRSWWSYLFCFSAVFMSHVLNSTRAVSKIRFRIRIYPHLILRNMSIRPPSVSRNAALNITCEYLM